MISWLVDKGCNGQGRTDLTRGCPFGGSVDWPGRVVKDNWELGADQLVPGHAVLIKGSRLTESGAISYRL